MKNPSKQNGMVLLISLVLLLLLTVIAIAAAHQSSLQARMSANSQQQNIAFQAAETGITDAVGTNDKKRQKPGQIAYDAGRGDIKKYPVRAPVSITPTSNYTIGAIQPTSCWQTMSANSTGGTSSPEYYCYNIESTGKSCADNSCNDSDNPAKARHLQGVLVRNMVINN